MNKNVDHIEWRIRLSANIVCLMVIVGTDPGHDMQDLCPVNLQFNAKNVNIGTFSSNRPH